MALFTKSLDSASRDLTAMYRALMIFGVVALVVICIGTYLLAYN